MIVVDARLFLSRCGDLNVSHQSIDLANGKSNSKVAGFTAEERDDFTQLLADGFIDSCKSTFSLKICQQTKQLEKCCLVVRETVPFDTPVVNGDAACHQSLIVDDTRRGTSLDVTFSFSALP